MIAPTLFTSVTPIVEADRTIRSIPAIDPAALFEGFVKTQIDASLGANPAPTLPIGSFPIAPVPMRLIPNAVPTVPQTLSENDRETLKRGMITESQIVVPDNALAIGEPLKIAPSLKPMVEDEKALPEIAEGPAEPDFDLTQMVITTPAKGQDPVIASQETAPSVMPHPHPDDRTDTAQFTMSKYQTTPVAPPNPENAATDALTASRQQLPVQPPDSALATDRPRTPKTVGRSNTPVVEDSQFAALPQSMSAKINAQPIKTMDAAEPVKAQVADQVPSDDGIDQIATPQVSASRTKPVSVTERPASIELPFEAAVMRPKDSISTNDPPLSSEKTAPARDAELPMKTAPARDAELQMKTAPARDADPQMKTVLARSTEPPMPNPTPVSQVQNLVAPRPSDESTSILELAEPRPDGKIVTPLPNPAPTSAADGEVKPGIDKDNIGNGEKTTAPKILLPDAPVIESGPNIRSDILLTETQNQSQFSPEPSRPTASHVEHAPRVIDSIVQAARAMSDRPVELALNPEELGRVRMTLHASDGGMSVQLVVERPETLELLRRNIEILAADLRAAGYERLSFGFAGDRQPGGQPAQDHQTSVTNTKDPGVQIADPIQTLSLTLGGDGLDLRI